MQRNLYKKNNANGNSQTCVRDINDNHYTNENRKHVSIFGKYVQIKNSNVNIMYFHEKVFGFINE